MNPDDDPEARIRQLEQPLANQGAVELGATAPSGNVPTAPLPPPVYGPPYQQSSPYSAPPFGVSYPQVKKGPPVGLIFGVIAVVVVAIFGAIGAVVWTMMAKTNDVISTLPSSFPSIESPTVPPEAPTVLPEEPSSPPSESVTVAPPGGQLSVAGVDKTETVDCNGANLSVSGVNNTVTVTGHCVGLTVSGVDNDVTVDSADRIDASGFDNRVIYHSGAPEIDATSANSVAQG